MKKFLDHIVQSQDNETKITFGLKHTMQIRSLAPWLLISYFMPFIAFFFGIFLFGLTVWIFLVGMCVVSFMTLLLFLNIKNWEIAWEKRIEGFKQKEQNRVKILTKQPAPPAFLSHFKNSPENTLKLISADRKNSIEEVEKEHEKIIDAYEVERVKLFDELKEKEQLLAELKEQNLAQDQKEKETLAQTEEAIKALKEEIASLKFELQTLLKLSEEELLSAISMP
jgi:hypothetical protein